MGRWALERRGAVAWSQSQWKTIIIMHVSSALTTLKIPHYSLLFPPVLSESYSSWWGLRINDFPALTRKGRAGFRAPCRALRAGCVHPVPARSWGPGRHLCRLSRPVPAPQTGAGAALEQEAGGKSPAGGRPQLAELVLGIHRALGRSVPEQAAPRGPCAE